MAAKPLAKSNHKRVTIRYGSNYCKNPHWQDRGGLSR